MATNDIVISHASVVRLTKLAFPARVLAGVYVLISVGLLVAAYFDVLQATERQRNRIPYAVVMYGCFVILFTLAAVRTWQTGVALAKVRRIATSPNLEKAVKHMYDMLLVFFAWMLLLAGTVIYGVFQPAY